MNVNRFLTWMAFSFFERRTRKKNVHLCKMCVWWEEVAHFCLALMGLIDSLWSWSRTVANGVVYCAFCCCCIFRMPKNRANFWRRRPFRCWIFFLFWGLPFCMRTNLWQTNLHFSDIWIETPLHANKWTWKTRKERTHKKPMRYWPYLPAAAVFCFYRLTTTKGSFGATLKQQAFLSILNKNKNIRV